MDMEEFLGGLGCLIIAVCGLIFSTGMVQGLVVVIFGAAGILLAYDGYTDHSLRNR